jgi:hypothetical protein
MCECGCRLNPKTVKIPGPDGKWWIVEMLSGCRFCDLTPSIRLTLTAAETCVGDPVAFIPEAIASHYDGLPIHVFTFGVRLDDFILAMREQFDAIDSSVSREEIDAEYGEIVADELWCSLMERPPWSSSDSGRDCDV